MNITQESDYAIRAVLILSKNKEKDILDAKTICELGSIPLRFLLKLLRKLIKSGIVKSYRGVNGGYSLAKEPIDINLKDIIEAIEGPIAINRCLYDKDSCSAGKGDNCCIHAALYRVQSTMINELEKINFENLRKGKW
ncbi:transcriptional regulator, BadM/Rrf2 family [Clostridium pasteurianum DSM 525 = ATCC 6013]|uniref:Transcriptional regulator, BadM/Rrf2 family n=1 Tax=Clostridium pasteurianum DSM 525 = ATCC 6013 TaxID=1262449 RepID=A0A0H3J486_CLOPA|nr:Rrf2 family transcriptional regulator [Clostridium pasteurianum]AJA47682.1 transcriptional regulator, BadM/Rrf2 family [Clostridium pasteurianum DSM 525 = ATCC 6013]AJA51670.1 transcriptional regulator, BadM/Rrf2 family [Clostridium pasteurianum DSM 525 = ATCC 6013]AOZ74986.1 transcriptional regulator [Clostridium pasteurianum DSM 525 = ATCC 6013]AOZ78781.1 transcriptional regulator [Clostridium pasteurianum]ELP59585.1 BadM/Rrf2 family transcriptional regulator [Clostridium pasteurianum DSM